MALLFDNKLKWDVGTEKLNAKSQKRMFFLRKMLSFNISSRMFQTFYCALVETVLSFFVLCWFGNATEAQKKAVRKIMTMSSILSGLQFPSLENNHKDRTIKKANSIVGDQQHPLAPKFEMLPPGHC